MADYADLYLSWFFVGFVAAIFISGFLIGCVLRSFSSASNILVFVVAGMAQMLWMVFMVFEGVIEDGWEHLSLWNPWITALQFISFSALSVLGSSLALRLFERP